MTGIDRRFSVAPMMDWTDRHCRGLHRLLTRRALLFTEMVTTGAVIHGDRARLLGYAPAEHPVALQLGGSDPADLAEAARIGAGFGYDEINLNVGCPSDRVQSGRFGACLMREPSLVGDCIAAMKAAVDVPVTVKCRIGVDEQDPETALDALAQAVTAAGVDALYVHARKAWLAGLSPKENREVPPLDYARVHRLKAAFPSLPVILNGGLATVEAGLAEIAKGLDGVMLGRAAYQDPFRLLAVDPLFFGEPAPFPDLLTAADAIGEHIACAVAEGTRFHALGRHLVGLFQGVPGARRFRQTLATQGVLRDVDARVWHDAVDEVRRAMAEAAARDDTRGSREAA